MSRVPYVTREELDSEGQRIYDRIRQDRNVPEVGLQFRALLNNPEAAGYMTSLGAQLRFSNDMPEDLKEFAILAVGREWDSAIEWTLHSPLAARAGVSAASMEALRTRQPLSLLTERERIVARFVQQLLRDKSVPDETFAAARQLLGTRGVVDLTLTVGYYSALALAQIALKLELDPGKVSTL